MRLWDAHYRNNMLVSYEGTHNRAIRARQVAVSDDSRVAFYPSGSSIEVYDVVHGQHVKSMQEGHTESINCVCYNPTRNELYSGANDGQVLVWQGNAVEEEEGDAHQGDQAGGANSVVVHRVRGSY